MRGLYWARYDLRLHDNSALNAFLQECSEGIILWCPNESAKRANTHRHNFIMNSLMHFNLKLKERGQNLVIGKLGILPELEAITKKFNIDKIYFTCASSIEEKIEENLVLKFCEEKKIVYEIFDQETLVNQADLPFSLEAMPFIFSDFRKKVEANFIVRPTLESTKTSNKPLTATEEKYEIDNATPLVFSGGEDAALQRIQHYFFESRAILTYKDTRNGMLNIDDSSRLSPWLNLGLLSPRMVIHQLKEFEAIHGQNESTYWLVFELLWRDYLKFFSRKYGNKIFLESGIKKGKHYQVEKNKTLFAKWCNGQTDEPFVNANMKELNQTGWMSNRGRQNVASYLVHHLKIPWTWGAAYFERQLIDYDPDLNWGNWLYLSGNGSDPRARIFNIQRQAEVYDPGSLYQKKWG